MAADFDPGAFGLSLVGNAAATDAAGVEQALVGRCGFAAHREDRH